jgi:F-type H+-transporting ATPase subunit b
MLQQAIGLLIQAVPTFIVVVFLHWYLKATLFQPVEKVLADRHAATEGARKRATEALEQAEKKVAEYDARLRDARTEIYKDQEAWRLKMLDEQNASLAKAREENLKAIATAKSSIAAEAEAAKATLSQQAEELATQIVAGISRASRN